MRRLGRRATTVLQHPGAFALAVLKSFRANQGVLLAGAVAYHTLLSLVPLLILALMALSHLFSEDQLLQTLREYLEFVVPGQSSALVQQLRTFLAHRGAGECHVGDLLSPGCDQTAALAGDRKRGCRGHVRLPGAASLQCTCGMAAMHRPR